MPRNIDRRSALTSIGALTITGLAGCAGFGSGSDQTDGGGDDDTAADNTDTDAGDTDTQTDDTDTQTDDTDTPASGAGDRFEYTFQSDDDAVESSLNGIRANYPDGSGAVSDASVATATLGGTDVTDDLDQVTTSNNDTSLLADFGGRYDIVAGETLVFELSGVDEPDGSYTVEVVVNPQSGATSFQKSF